jgi:hypothetical protein
MEQLRALQASGAVRAYPALWAAQGRGVDFQPDQGASLFRGGARASDVVQGRNGDRYLGDCWLLASVASIAHSQPQLLEQAITHHRDGTYTVRLIGRRDLGHRPGLVRRLRAGRKRRQGRRVPPATRRVPEALPVLLVGGDRAPLSGRDHQSWPASTAPAVRSCTMDRIAPAVSSSALFVTFTTVHWRLRRNRSSACSSSARM